MPIAELPNTDLAGADGTAASLQAGSKVLPKTWPKTWVDRYRCDAPVTGLVSLADEDRPTSRAMAAVGDGTIVFAPPRDSEGIPGAQDAETGWRKLSVHGTGISLCLSPGNDGESALSAGDDGRLVRIGGDGALSELALHKGKWIEHVVAHPGTGLIAYAVGKDVHVLDRAGQPLGAPLSHKNTAAGIAISPNGKRLAVAHYGGISLWWLNSKTQTPVIYPWAGSHLDVCWHPDGGHVLTTTQESSLHGWRLSDGMEMRMQGYAAKVASWGWTPRGKFLVTSGAEQAVAWPFTGGGPWGKPPALLGDALGLLVTRVAPHPEDEMVAVGYENGAVVFVALAAGAPPLPILPPTGAPVTMLTWSPDGKRLLSGDEAGWVHDFTLSSVTAAFRQ